MKTLIMEHSNVSGMTCTHKPEGEGQHVQSVYSPVKRLGGMDKFAFNKGAHMTETSQQNSSKRLLLFREWSRFWELDHPYLIEKSPRHVVMTRFLQAYFTADASFFVNTIRHPLGCTHLSWTYKDEWKGAAKTCGRGYIKHWLAMYVRRGV